MKVKKMDRFVGCLVGLAVGDAVGTSAEFAPRGSFDPLTDLVGGGPFNLNAGEWTDDTSMALCLASSLLENNGFDPEDQMQRYLRWRDEGYLSSNGDCFDIGTTVSNALFRYELMGNPYAGSCDPNSAGNGCIMRLAPVPMFYAKDLEQSIFFAAESSRTTHGANECLDACRLLAYFLNQFFNGKHRDSTLLNTGVVSLDSQHIKVIATGEFLKKHEDEILGTGYVVKSLEAALWCFYKTSNYKDAVLAAANLGDDADTTAAICGQLAGAYYGINGIPVVWREKLAKKALIEQLAQDLYLNNHKSDFLAGRDIPENVST